MTLKTLKPAQVEQEFRRLRQQWKEDCAYLSSTTAMVRHPAYQAIVDLGEPVVPLLLRDLESEAIHWFVPNLTATNSRITSPASRKYNCIAWAVS
jgi:hypothetical protein